VQTPDSPMKVEKRAFLVARYRALLSLVSTLLFVACARAERPVPKSGEAREQPPGVRLVASMANFRSPESVRYDPDQDVWFVSNIAGFGSDKDGRGYIVRIDASRLDSSSIFAISGVNGVHLDAPKGMAIQGDTLWVADIDVLRGFDRRNGLPVATIDFTAFKPTLLNDVAVGPDGTLRVTDSGILMTEKGVLRPGGDKIFSVGAGRVVTVLQRGPQLGEPNGITWDSAGGRWIVVGFRRFNATVDAYARDMSASQKVSASGGEFDGVEVLPTGAVVYTCWTDSSVHVVADGRDEKLVRFVPEAADIGYDRKRGVIAIPLVMMDQVAFYALPSSITGPTRAP
jgi:sugar lactone lactonase YvrE